MEYKLVNEPINGENNYVIYTVESNEYTSSTAYGDNIQSVREDIENLRADGIEVEVSIPTTNVKVVITETLQRVIELDDVFNCEDAINLVKNRYSNEEIILDSNDFVDVEFLGMN